MSGAGDRSRRFALGVALYAGATVVLVGGISRFEAVGPERLVTPGAVGGWQVDPYGTGSMVEEAGALVLQTGACPGSEAEVRCGVVARQSVPAAGARLLVFTADVARAGLAVRPQEAPLARILHYYADPDGRTFTDYYHVLDEGTRDAAWHRAQHGFLVDPGATDVVVRVDFAATSGAMSLRDVSLREARFRPAWLALGALIVSGWVALGVTTARALVASADRRWAAGLAIVIAAGMVPVLLLPQTGVIVVARDVDEQLQVAPSAAPVAPSAAPVASVAPAVAPVAPRRLVTDLAAGVGQDAAHVVMFVALGAATSWSRRRATWDLAVGLVTFAVASEAVQIFTLDRGVALGDVGLDVVGALIGAFVAARFGAWYRP